MNQQTLQHGPAAMREAALLLIGAGIGCDAVMNGEPRNLSFYARLEERGRRVRPQAREAKKLWGIVDG